MSGAVPWYDEVVQTPLHRTGSYWAIPTGPGLGIEIDEAAAARHPFKPEVVHTRSALLEDGTVVDW
jgi:galactonate dehydratase